MAHQRQYRNHEADEGKPRHRVPSVTSNKIDLGPLVFHPRGSAGDTDALQAKVDNGRIASLAQGLLRAMDIETGLTVQAERYYAPSRGDSKSHLAGKWITMQEAQMETGLRPPEAVDNVVQLPPQSVGSVAVLQFASQNG